MRILPRWRSTTMGPLSPSCIDIAPQHKSQTVCTLRSAPHTRDKARGLADLWRSQFSWIIFFFTPLLSWPGDFALFVCSWGSPSSKAMWTSHKGPPKAWKECRPGLQFQFPLLSSFFLCPLLLSRFYGSLHFWGGVKIRCDIPKAKEEETLQLNSSTN